MAICSECGAIVPDTQRYCLRCGKRIDLDEGWSPPAQRIAPEPRADWMHDDGATRKGGARSGTRPQEAQEDAAPGADAPQRAQAYDRPAYRSGHAQRPLERPRAAQQSYSFSRARPQAQRMDNHWQEPEERERPARTAGIAPLSTGMYFVRLLLSVLPVVGLLMGFLWMRSAPDANMRNFGKAVLVLNAVLLAGSAGAFALFRWVL